MGNYYVYDFGELLAEMQELNSQVSTLTGQVTTLTTELKDLKKVQKTQHSELVSGFNIVTAIMVGIIAIKVMFK